MGTLDEKSLLETNASIKYYFEHNNQMHLQMASSCVYDIESNLVGVCLVSIWEELPLIYEVAVLPQYRGNGLAKFMMLRAIDQLSGYYPVIRLFVTSENTAQNLYKNIGFLSGGKAIQLKFGN